MCYGFQVMTVNESPNTPFTILYEQFEKGMLASLFITAELAMASLSTVATTMHATFIVIASIGNENSSSLHGS